MEDETLHTMFKLPVFTVSAIDYQQHMVGRPVGA
jgi:hypothetical protein